jgi:replicative DNA helicase
LDQTPRTPPHSLEAEKSVLGSMLISRDAAELAAEMLSASDFYVPQHQDIFEAMTELVSRAQPVDSVTIVDALERAGKLASAGGLGYIAELSLFVPSAANVSYYINIVEDRSVLRQLIKAGGEIMNEASTSDSPVTDILDEAERRVFSISMKKNEETLVPVDKSAMAAYMRIGELMRTRGQISGVPTGFRELDELTSGLQKGDLIIVAARPSVGKSTFAMNIAEYAATTAGKRVAVFSLEMSREQLTTRMLCSQAKVDMQKVNSGETTEEDLLVLSDALLTLSDSKMYIDDSGNLSVADIRSRCRRQKTRYGLDLVVVDYLGLLQLTSKRGSLVADIAEATRALKILAKELEVPIMLLCQLSRGSESRKENGYRPILADLRDSGAIEQDADLVLLLYRKALAMRNRKDDSASGAPNEEIEDNSAEVIVAKNRNGPLKTVNLAWQGMFARFVDPS